MECIRPLLRQHATANPSISWATLDGSIHAATFLASRTGSGMHCHLCADSSHLAHECALAPLLNPHQTVHSTSGQAPPYRQAPPSSSSMRPICNSWNRESVRTHQSVHLGTYVQHAKRVLTRQKTAFRQQQTVSSTSLLCLHDRAPRRTGPNPSLSLLQLPQLGCLPLSYPSHISRGRCIYSRCLPDVASIYPHPELILNLLLFQAHILLS